MTSASRSIQVGSTASAQQQAESRWTRPDTALVILLGLLVALFFWRILTPNPLDRAQFPPGDFTDQFYAFRLYEARAFLDGQIPLWSENFNSGHPFLADIQSAVFYPPALVNTLLNLVLFRSFSLFALELEALFHFWLAAAFTYLFARRVLMRSVPSPGMARAGAFVSAIVFTFGGYLTSYPSLQLAILETAVWLPLALYFLDRAGESLAPRSIRDSVTQGTTIQNLLATALVLGVAALAGHPQTFLFVVSTCALYFGARVWNYRAREGTLDARRLELVALGMFGSVFALALALAAVQLVPAIEYQQLSTREALSFADAAKGFPTLDVLQFILPGYASAFASPLYVGVLPLWLAILALLRRGRARVFWGLTALVALIFSFGFYVFAYVVFYLFIPGASLFREQERLAFVVSFALAMLAGYGITDLLSTFNVQHVRKLYALLPVGAALLLVLLLTFFVAGVQNPAGRLSFLGDRAGLMLILFALTSLLLGLYLYRFSKTSGTMRWFIPLVVLLILFDLWSVNEPSNKGQVQDRFADMPFATLSTTAPGTYRVAADDQLMPGHFGIPTHLEEISGISPLRLARYDALLKLPSAIVFPLLNVKYHITQGPTANGKVVATDSNLNLVEFSNSLPRAWLVGNAVVQPDDAQAASILANNLNPAEQAILPAPPPFALDPKAATGTVEISSRTPAEMTLNVNAPASGLLMLSENFYPGWQATVDGQPVDILRADLTLRAIPIRVGQHNVQVWYDPLSFKLGAGITFVALIVCVGGLGYFAIKREPR